jgi:response regulator RpfG family c-di-GMP phosphodiesterase
MARVQFALAESSIGSTSGLLTLLGSLYRYQPDRAAHVHRVAVTSLSIGDRLRLSRQTLRHVERAALLHELGRLILPDESFAADEGPDGRRVHQAQAAWHAVQVAPVLRPAGDIVGAMCERVDGGGWPKGLAGDDIPIGARIVTVADAMDALAALCVEMGMPAEVLAAELVEHAGTRFDPTVVAAVVRWLDGVPLGVPPMQPPMQAFV